MIELTEKLIEAQQRESDALDEAVRLIHEIEALEEVLSDSP